MPFKSTPLGATHYSVFPWSCASTSLVYAPPFLTSSSCVPRSTTAPPPPPLRFLPPPPPPPPSPPPILPSPRSLPPSSPPSLSVSASASPASPRCTSMHKISWECITVDSRCAITNTVVGGAASSLPAPVLTPAHRCCMDCGRCHVRVRRAVLVTDRTSNAQLNRPRSRLVHGPFIDSVRGWPFRFFFTALQ